MKVHKSSLGSDVEAAKRLPGPMPGVQVTIPLRLLPQYLELHGLKPERFVKPDVVVVVKLSAVSE